MRDFANAVATGLWPVDLPTTGFQTRQDGPQGRGYNASDFA